MSSVIRYQFLHSRETQVVRFDGPSLSLDALRREIAQQNSLHSMGADLVITDTGGSAFAQGSQVHKNSSVLVKSRAPGGPAIVVGATDAATGGIPGLGGAVKRCGAGGCTRARMGGRGRRGGGGRGCVVGGGGVLEGGAGGRGEV